MQTHCYTVTACAGMQEPLHQGQHCVAHPAPVIESMEPSCRGQLLRHCCHWDGLHRIETTQDQAVYALHLAG